jgi:predicted dehydrogenase
MYKLGIISTSFIVDTFMQACNLEPRINVTSLFSSNPKAQELADKHQITTVYDNYQDFLASDIDMVYIASANVAHFDQAMAAIKAQKHLLIEKPMALKPEHINKLYNASLENNVFIMEALTLIAMPNLQILKELTNKIGTIKHVKFNMLQQTRHYQNYLNGEYFNVFDIAKGGGAMYDLGTYLIHPMIYLFGKPNNQTDYAKVNAYNCDLTNTSVFNYNGFDVVLSCSKECFDPSNSVICGDLGTIEIKSMSLLQTIILYSPDGIIQEQFENKLEHRMLAEINHFVDVVSSGEYQSNLYTQTLAQTVCDIIYNVDRK